MKILWMSLEWSLFRSFVQFFNIKLFSHLELTDSFSKRGFTLFDPILMAFVTAEEYFWINFEHTSISSAFLAWGSSCVDSAS